MILGSVIRDFYIDAWRHIPDLVTAMDDDDGRIRKNDAIAPNQANLERTVTLVSSPSVIVAYQGYTKGDTRRAEITKHHIAAYVRAMTLDDDAHILIGQLLIEAIPSGGDISVRYLEPHEDADCMDMPKYERITLGELNAGTDIWKLSFTVPER